jgi:protein-disulfide isomerase
MRSVWVLAALVLVGVMAFSFWPKDQTSESTGDVSLDKSVGDENAPLVVVEYGDFQCPACQRFFQTTAEQLKTEYVQTGKVRFVFRQFAFLGDESQWAAEASECANEQGRFWDYYDKLYQAQNGENVGVFSKDNLKQFAVELGLDTTRFSRCLDSGRYTEKVKQETLEGQQAGVRGTPSVFVNGQYIENGSSYPVLQAAVEAALGK